MGGFLFAAALVVVGAAAWGLWSPPLAPGYTLHVSGSLLVLRDPDDRPVDTKWIDIWGYHACSRYLRRTARRHAADTRRNRASNP